jgi:hypothetical protein
MKLLIVEVVEEENILYNSILLYELHEGVRRITV